MLYHLLFPLADVHIVFNLFRYITFRTAGAMVTSLLLSFLLGPWIIRRLRALRVGQVVRDVGPAEHLSKAGTPTMGGVLILAATTISTLLWAKLNQPNVLIVLAVLLWTGTLGFIDDYLKVVRKRTEGLVARYKLAGQGVLGMLLALALLVLPVMQHPTWSMVPFFADWHVEFLAWAFVPWVMFVLVGSSNAVNLADGLDGLAAGLAAIAAGTFGVFAYVIGRTDTSQYLNLLYIPGAGELTIFCAAVAGAALGFLWFNAHPAEVFMGDTGSLALGGAIGAVAILLRMEFLLVLVGGVFVMEALSVILQVGWFRWTASRTGTGRRIFAMAPIHHHFEQKGWPESKVIIRFWILGILFALMAFSTLKIR
jgi:phospho-N-acetylmuramoyl-pentapeptide-transferase